MLWLKVRNLLGYLLGLAHDRYCGCAWPNELGTEADVNSPYRRVYLNEWFSGDQEG